MLYVVTVSPCRPRGTALKAQQQTFIYRQYDTTSSPPLASPCARPLRRTTAFPSPPLATRDAEGLQGSTLPRPSPLGEQAGRVANRHKSAIMSLQWRGFGKATGFRPGPKWRNWQTRQSQKLLGGNSRAGSSPAFGTSRQHRGLGRGGWLLASFSVPSSVKVAHGTLDPIVQVRILARQPRVYIRKRSPVAQR